MFEKNEIIESHTLEECDACKKQLKRKFSQGDYVFKYTSKCSSCNGQVIIAKIFGETLTPQ